jgi:hypothetical protein
MPQATEVEWAAREGPVLVIQPVCPAGPARARMVVVAGRLAIQPVRATALALRVSAARAEDLA